MTNILALPVYGFDISAGNNEDLRFSVGYVDDQIASVRVYIGGSNVGGVGFTGTLQANFGIPASGEGYPATGTAAVLNGTLTGVTLDDPGAGYGVAELVQLSIPGAGQDVVVAVNVGNSIALDGIIIDFEARDPKQDNLIVVSASTQPNIIGLPTTAALSITQNIMTITIMESVMSEILPGTYSFEARAFADGATRVIAKGNLIVDARSCL